MYWLSLIVTAGVAVYWFRQARTARDELANARWALSRALNKELKNRPPKVYLMPRREEPKHGGAA